MVAKTTDTGGDERRGGRIAALDATRGMAVAAMVGYHALFDLKFYFGKDFLSGAPWAWTFSACMITATFLLCSGVAARVGRAGTSRFLRRQARLGAAAATVSLSTWLMAPDWWIRFGVLHCLFVTGFACQVLRRAPRVAGILGVVVGAGWWAGLIPDLPARTGLPTFDFVPVVPWAAVALLGVAGGGIFLWPRLTGAGRQFPRLEWLGRHSLAIYLLHQPVIMGAMAAVRFLPSLLPWP